ncbi:hypothetical protein MEQU1_000789 [Malassezia equina]|uniref:Golgi pH regulator n=1 Tax=Malassezia equina TaxID=1381935 RepID=A0AAF0EGW7_9BASI|nr:hypothetical protein MEQU1_000789 [Malassezia equina]
MPGRGGTIVVVLLLRLVLFVGAYGALPWLIGEARYVSLESQSETPDEIHLLPSVSHARTRSVPQSARLARLLHQSFVQSISLPSILFYVAVEESLILFVLVLLEHIYLHGPTLLLQWRISLTAVILCIVLWLPLCASALLCFGGARGRWVTTRAVASLSLFVGWCWAFLRVPLPSAMASTASGWSGGILARTAMIGVSLIAVLSGSVAAGAMGDSYELMIRRRRRWGEQDVAATRTSFQRTVKELQMKRAAADDVEAELEAGGARSSWTRWWYRSQKDRELALLRSEITGLSAVANAMRSDLEHQEAQERRVQYVRTWPGYVMLLGGYLFSAYCMARLMQCVLNMLVFGYELSSTRDLVSTCLAQAMRWLGLQVDVAAWSPRISFLMVGGLIVMRLRRILGGLSSVIQSVSTGISTQLLVLFTAQVLCIYVLAALIQLHAGASTAMDKSALLASLPEFQRVFGRVFDVAFLASASVTGAARWYAWHADVSLHRG